MHSGILHILLFLFFLSGVFVKPLHAQTDSSRTTDFIIVENIEVKGNKRTKAFIIERELNFKISDTLKRSDLPEIIRKSNNRLFNTTLFLEAEVAFTGTDSTYKTCTVYVKERWFTYVIPIIGLADRNFNEWWVQRNHDLSRIEWGAYFMQKNMRGRNETMKLKVELGFVKKGEITYTIPYLTKSRKLGIILYTGFMLNKQVAYNTIENKLKYLEGDDNRFIRHRYSSSVTFTYRGSFYLTHQLGASYSVNTISDILADTNSRYFLHGQDRQEFVSLKYSLIRDHRDLMYYPLKGSYLRFDAEQMGLGISRDISLTSFKAEVSLFKPLSRRFFFAGTLKGKYSNPVEQPYFNQRGLGYDKEYVSGYEQYVIDGQKYILNKLNVKFKLFEWKAKIEGLPEDRFNNIPLRIFLKAYADMAYVWDGTYQPGNAIYANTFLSGAGVGFDFVSYYDFVMRVEYSVNRDLNSGVFINFKAGI